MAIIRWEPFSSMDDVFNRALRRHYAFDNDVEGKRSFLPSADISETDKEYLIRTELPSVKKGDVHVTTEDGRTIPFWEFNLRFKTDSGRVGPSPGKPVLLQAGMQGDRASIVFSSPAEISRLIEERC